MFYRLSCTILGLFVFGLCLFIRPVESSLLTGLSFDEPTGTVLTTESIVMWGTLTNLPESDENIVYVGGGGIGYSSYTTWFYDDVWGYEDYRSQFDGINLSPGENISFIFNIFAPKNPPPINPQPEGLFQTTGNPWQLWVQGSGGTDLYAVSSNTFQRNVVAPATVPVPPTAVLLGFGIVGIYTIRKNIRK